jgi:hypothetical protein
MHSVMIRLNPLTKTVMDLETMLQEIFQMLVQQNTVTHGRTIPLVV